jgi:hypothetical protein
MMSSRRLLSSSASRFSSLAFSSARLILPSTRAFSSILTLSPQPATIFSSSFIRHLSSTPPTPTEAQLAFTTQLMMKAEAARLNDNGYSDEATEKYKELLSLQQAGQPEGENHPDALVTMKSIINILDSKAHKCYEEGRWADALSLNEQALEMETKTKGEDHPETIMTM